jgi:hypothetical protein
MQVTLDIPDDISRAFTSAAVPLDRAAREGLAAEAYRSGVLSEYQLMRLLELPSRFAVHDWLSRRQIPLRYTEATYRAICTT